MEEEFAPHRPWCVEMVGDLRKRLEEKGWTVYESWGYDGEPEVITFWPESGDAHCRFIIGEEDDGKRYGFVSLGVQGGGCIQQQFPIRPHADDWPQSAAWTFDNFRRMVDRLRGKSA